MLFSVRQLAMKAMEPLKLMKNTTANACLWLEHCPNSERPIWKILWNSASMKCTTDKASDYLMSRSELMKPDCVFDDSSHREDAHMQRRNSKAQMEKQKHTKSLIQLSLERMANNMDKGEEDCDRIVVLGGITGRFDHTLATLQALVKACKKGVEVFACDGENLVVVLPEGKTELDIDKRYLTGKCGFSPVCQRETSITTDGFKWDLDDEYLSFEGLISTSNQIQAKTVYVKCSAPVLFTMELSCDSQRGMISSKL